MTLKLRTRVWIGASCGIAVFLIVFMIAVYTDWRNDWAEESEELNLSELTIDITFNDVEYPCIYSNDVPVENMTFSSPNTTILVVEITPDSLNIVQTRNRIMISQSNREIYTFYCDLKQYIPMNHPEPDHELQSYTIAYQ